MASEASDDLRSRIAAAIYEASDEYTRKLMVNPRLPGCADVRGDSKPVCYVLADAVIRELGLRMDTTCHIHDREGKQRCHRYVTEWTADDE